MFLRQIPGKAGGHWPTEKRPFLAIAYAPSTATHARTTTTTTTTLLE